MLSIIIVNYNTKELLASCLSGLLTPDMPNMEIIVVDNHSADGSQEYLNNLSHVKVSPLLLNKNIGFSAANNIGITKASGDTILILNPDTFVSAPALNACITALQSDSSIGALGCRVLLEDGSLDLACRRSFPTLLNSFFRFSKLSLLFKNSKLFAGYNLTYLPEEGCYEVDAIVGAFMLIPKSIFDKIGLFDERFFMYAEDIDLCRRIKKAGYKVYYFGRASILHHKRASSKKSTQAKEAFFTSMQLYYQKHHEADHTKLVNQLVYIIIRLFKKLRQ